ncbi:MAG: glycerate kinase, partial [Sciscionella sp.]
MAATGSNKRVVLAPDKFKGSLRASEVAAALADGLRRTDPDLLTVAVPIADGGDGTVDAVLSAGFVKRVTRVPGPLGDPVDAEFALRGDTAVVELAQSSGLARLKPGNLDPMACHTRGVGRVLAAALDAGARRIVLGVGGSASTDGGAGMLTELGVRFTDNDGRPLADGGGALRRLDMVDLTGLDPRLRATEVILACDVDNPLLGEQGAAAVYAPQ